MRRKRLHVTKLYCSPRLAVVIACLGLLGMISNKVVEKTKEIGIRKVLGAQLYNIARVLLNSTVKADSHGNDGRHSSGVLFDATISGEIFRTHKPSMVALCFTCFDFGC